MNYVGMTWKAEYLPEKHVEMWRWDEYNPAGYAGQVVVPRELPQQNPCNANAQRFTYYATSEGTLLRMQITAIMIASAALGCVP